MDSRNSEHLFKKKIVSKITKDSEKKSEYFCGIIMPLRGNGLMYFASLGPRKLIMGQPHMVDT